MIQSPQLLMIGTIALGVVGAGGYFWGRSDGRDLERAAWTARDNKALREANAKLDEMHRKVRDQERAHAAMQAQLVIDYEKELDHVENERDRALGAVRRGELRMRDSAATSNLTCDARVSVATTGAAAGKPAAAREELPDPRAEAVVRLLSEADELAAEVNECWAVVRADRAVR